MRKQHGAFAAFTIRHIDISDLHEKADQVEVLSLAVKDFCLCELWKISISKPCWNFNRI